MKPLLSLALALLLPLAVQAEEAKGSLPGSQPRGLVTAYNPPAAAAARRDDLEVGFRYSGPGQNGKSFPLADGTTLKSGDQYTLAVRARADLYLYVYHFDGHGYLRELVSAKGYDNHLRAGQSLALPAADRHYTLDANPGEEVFHFIVSPAPRNDLQAAYREQLRRDDGALLLVSKGATDDPDTAPAAAAAERAAGVRVVTCPAGEACRESFRIHHAAR